MLPTTEEFLAKIDRFLAETRMTDNEFGRAACNNSHFLERLRAGVKRGKGSVKLDMANHLARTLREARKASKTAAE